MRQLFLGMDIGGSKTDVLLADENGKKVATLKPKGINLHNQQKADAKRILESICDTLKQKTKTQNKELPISSVCIGVTSFDSKKDKSQWRQIIQHSLKKSQIAYEQLNLVSDAHLSLKSGTRDIPAMCLIVGTGVSCVGIDEKNQEHKAGDWGYLAGDQGSGYWIGQHFLQHSLKELDGRAPKSIVSELILSHTQNHNLDELIDWVYQNASISSIASLTQLLSNPVLVKQTSIQTILHQAIEEVCISLSAVYSQLETSSSIKLVCTGGMFTNKEYASRFLDQLSHTMPYLKTIFPTEKPVYTALDIAMTKKL